ncbi:MAG: hypothetical protein GX783_00255 [Clostridiales bacterium]|nr:hypothetical protein [Clostridiales bacterium]
MKSLEQGRADFGSSFLLPTLTGIFPYVIINIVMAVRVRRIVLLAIQEQKQGGF